MYAHSFFGWCIVRCCSDETVSEGRHVLLLYRYLLLSVFRFIFSLEGQWHIGIVVVGLMWYALL